MPVGRLAPRAFVTLGRIQAISADKGPLNNCQKAMLSLEKDCCYENSNSHSLTALHANSKTVSYRTLQASPQPSPPIGPSASHPTITTEPAPPRTPHAPHPTHTYPTPTHPPRTLPASPQPSPPIGPSTSHPTITTEPALPGTPRPPHPTHTHPTPTHPPHAPQ